jgi:UDP-N-acetylglucosamine 1-carboxyvinyltransferase
MGLLRITGRVPLSGSVRISGRKNAALKLIAAAVLSDSPVTLNRMPDIGDVRVMLTILETLGAKVSRDLENESVTIDASSITEPSIPHDLGRKLRASLVLVGPLLSRFGRATFPHPGGCVIGKRSIEPHLDAFRHLGASIEFDGKTYHLTANRLLGTEVYLKERSVTGTENLIMAACRAEGTTTIINAAQELHITNLCDLLRLMGFEVSGDGTSTVTVVGNPQLSTMSADVEIIADEIEVGTFAVAALVTGGTVTLERVGTKQDILPILSKLDDFNAKYEYDATTQSLTILPSPDLVAADIQANPWPGFPPDLLSPFTVLATQAKGTCLIHDWMYDGRLYFVDMLQKMGADITICDPHRAIVHGPTVLAHSTNISPDLRAGAALVLAALVGEGESVIEHVELIDRGYVRLEERLRALGANITREG